MEQATESQVCGLHWFETVSLPAFVTTEHAKIGLETASSPNPRYCMGHTYTKKTQVFVVYLKFNLAPVFLFAISGHPTLKAIIPPLRAVRSKQPRALSGVPFALSSWERSEWHQ